MNELKDRAADVDRKKNFKYTVTEDRMIKQDLPVGRYTLACLTCNRTCHDNCDLPDDNSKRKCRAMNDNGYCRICPGGCFWSIHKSLRYQLKIESVTVEKTVDELKQRYEEAQQKFLTSKQSVNTLCDEFKEIQMKISNWIDKVRISLDRLQQIALKAHPHSILEYIDLLIQLEMNEAWPGWKNRVDQLRQIRKNADQYIRITTQVCDSFPAYKKKVQGELEAGEGSIAVATAGKYLRDVVGLSV